MQLPYNVEHLNLFVESATKSITEPLRLDACCTQVLTEASSAHCIVRDPQREAANLETERGRSTQGW